METTINTFEAGKTYSMSFIGDSALRPAYTCLKRTANSATFVAVNGGETITRKIRVYGESEYIVLGSYSMAPRITASRIVN